MTGSRPIFRVSFSGPDFESKTLDDLLKGPDRCWEGSRGYPDRDARHRALVGAESAEEAITLVRGALSSAGEFVNFRAEPVRDAQGGMKHTPLRKTWDEIDWEEVASKVTLSHFERTLVSTFLNAAEPTWIILNDPDVPDDHERVEATLRDLERRELVYGTKEVSGEPGRESELTDWWALTDEGWDLLGLIKSPRYH